MEKLVRGLLADRAGGRERGRDTEGSRRSGYGSSCNYGPNETGSQTLGRFGSKGLVQAHKSEGPFSWRSQNPCELGLGGVDDGPLISHVFGVGVNYHSFITPCSLPLR